MRKVPATEEEKRNGWTDESLHEYRRERERANAMAVYYKEPKRPVMQNHRYNPLKWRRR
jgi:hypothetical protein